MMNILQALEDANLFAPWFRGDSWASWKSFLSALFGLEMDERQTEFYRRHTGREHPPVSAFRECWTVVGRRGGKSLIAALIAT